MATFTADEFANKLNDAINAIGESLPAVIDARANNAISLIKSRVIQKGLEVDEGGNETAFPAYSESYQKKREKKGLNVSPNRLVYSGDMLRKLKIVGRQQSDTKYTAIVGGSDQFSEDKLEYNSERYGDVLKLSNSEVSILEEAATDDLLEIFRNALE